MTQQDGQLITKRGDNLASLLKVTIDDAFQVAVELSPEQPPGETPKAREARLNDLVDIVFYPVSALAPAAMNVTIPLRACRRRCASYAA